MKLENLGRRPTWQCRRAIAAFVATFKADECEKERKFLYSLYSDFNCRCDGCVAGFLDACQSTHFERVVMVTLWRSTEDERKRRRFR